MEVHFRRFSAALYECRAGLVSFVVTALISAVDRLTKASSWFSLSRYRNVVTTSTNRHQDIRKMETIFCEEDQTRYKTGPTTVPPSAMLRSRRFR